MGLSRWQMGDASGFGERVRRATHRAQDLPFPYGPFSSLYVLTYKVLVLNEMGRFDRAATETARGVELSDTHQLSFWPIALDAAGAVTEAGRELASDAPDPEVLRAAADRLGGAALLYRMVGTVLIVPYVLTIQARALVGAGDFDAADAALDEAMALAEETGSNWYTAETHRIRARVMAGRGAPGQRGGRRGPVRRDRSPDARARCPSRPVPSTTCVASASTSPASMSCSHDRAPPCRPASSRPPFSEPPKGRRARRRHGRRHRGVATERTRVAGTVREHHDLSAGRAPRRQGGEQPRGQRPDRGARPARLARPLRQRLPPAPRGATTSSTATAPTPTVRSAPSRTRCDRRPRSASSTSTATAGTTGSASSTRTT